MEEKMRIEKLGEILSQQPHMTGIRINYQGEIKVMNAYKIPLDYLIYNKYNGRIGTRVKSFEKEKYILDPENENHKAMIEEFLWLSKEDRNETTEKSLAKDGQQKYGIVTRNGIIIDGNRRASILNRIYRQKNHKYNDQQVEHAKYFIAVILPNNAEKKDIMALETRYQMGVDEKVDYNAIEKYLKCADLLDNDFNIDEIADMMGEKVNKINEYLDMLELMNRYLDAYGYEGIYTRLEKREGQFVDLLRYLDSYQNHRAFTDWGYDDTDINDLESICFDYIRARYEGKQFRNIANVGKKEMKSIFSSEKVWNNFKEEHFKLVENIEEDDVDDIREENPDEDISLLLEKRDLDWENKVIGNFKGNLNKSYRKVEDYQQSNKPEKLLQSALGTLEAINTDVDNFTSSTVEDLVNQINSLTYEFKKVIRNRRKK
ncbi:hypothetical protein [Clostridium sp. 'White wine YQ']|uniref:hypothetical protein n=1 Tax=Clostridium sp. 'White wine YQ' TaxID=3027474 RepID=UPI00236725C7|nr:hypothetical protein [Clostridium sp. 'White wine YQ']MDD7794357.1 hypothetical protein [Clostridium sp. 'White wine YQ']